MKILQVVPHYIPATSFGGVLQVANELGKALQSLNHEVTVVTTDLKNRKEKLELGKFNSKTIDSIKIFYEKVIFLNIGVSR